MDKGDGMYVALGITSGKLGLYMSRSVVVEGKPVGVAVVKYPLAILHEGPYWDDWSARGDCYMIVDADGIVFSTNDRALMFGTLTPLDRATLDSLEQSRKYEGVDFHPLPLEASLFIDGEERWTMTLSGAGGGDNPGKPGAGEGKIEYVGRIASLPLPGMGWKLLVFSPFKVQAGGYVVNVLLVLFSYAIAVLLAYIVAQNRKHLRGLYAAAIRDPLTGAYTRLYMNEAVEKLLNSHDNGRIGGIVAVVLDIDRFKPVNDNFGHQAGDRVLRRVAETIIDETRPTDIAVRLGGEEFGVFMLAGDLEQGIQFAERVRLRVKELEFPDFAPGFRITLSAGVALRDMGEALSDLVNRADQLMYDAKAAGRDRVLPRPSTTAHPIPAAEGPAPA